MCYTLHSTGTCVPGSQYCLLRSSPPLADGSVWRDEISGRGYSASSHYTNINEGSGATSLTTSSMCVEIKAITEALGLPSSRTARWCAFSGYSVLDMQVLYSLKFLWHAGVGSNERADTLAGSAVTLDPPTVLSTVCDHLASTKEEEFFTKTVLVEKRVMPGEGRKSDLSGPLRRYSNQLMMETLSMPILKRTLMKRSYGYDEPNHGTK